MDDHAIVLNAGSSSLKFSIYRRPEAANRGGGASAPLWGVDLRGQIDGIGTSPRFTAKDGSDARLLYLETSYVQHPEPSVTQVTPGGDN